MSQSNRLGKTAKIELTAKQLRPPEGSKAVGSLDDGTVIWEGPIFAGNPLFKDHSDPAQAKYNGHVRVPVMDPLSKEPRWKKNNRGEPVSQVFRNRRQTVIRRFIMADDGNGGGGPRPVPGLTAEERSFRDRAEGHDNWLKGFTDAAQAEGLSPAEALALLKAQAAPKTDDEAPKRKPGRPKSNPEPVSIDG